MTHISNASPEQAEQFVSLWSKGAAPDKAMNTVNANVRSERACGVGAIAYIWGQTVDTRKLQNQLARSCASMV